ncbi:sugar ABC transporter substrate-binding protein [Streptomyces avermitilis]|uniref:Multiple sugar ABC transporter substrate-binding protein n=3 Tax=Streptomyces avermitilis TaxID=33903 RepID=Q82N49_STRAW|nr:extracellular solute-binding protein [Streptomyces avermitilis]MYS97085.1 extracellular solute-binding protein [Streptomyces sp. SID5469]KUN55126.1 sugar ABC transporter substrate-binding protein [Streptomyces avermitilis]OOV26765.1 sugar ABC transporter substrate-binding protein [Streptomyces avermitilis]BAC69164.1 putative multiple sugar ABC transporter substrate-binding protein [Streptomyces avermitilis MA-4680 = NBRC 14893]GDY61159.1 sugar ABC transporter substrate-binding protein [Stre
MKNTGQLSRRGLLAVAGFAGLAALTGCGSGDGEADTKDLSKKRAGAMKNYGAGDQFKATKALTFTILHNDMPTYPMKRDWLFWKEVTERTGVTLKPTSVPASDYDKKRSLLIGAGDAPLLIPKTYPGQETAFVSSGAILPVSEYVRLMPNFRAKVEKWGLEGDLDSIRQADGNYYVLPGLHEKVKSGYSLSFRTDVLKKHGLDLPTTWDQVYDVLKALKAAYPDVYPFSDRWGQPTPGGALLNYLGPAFGTKAGWSYANTAWDTKARKYVFTGATDEYRQMLEYLRKLVAEKLMDPESFTQSDDDAVRKLLSGKSFVISANPQELVQNYRYNLGKQVKGATIEMIPVPIGPTGEVIVGSRLENGLMVAGRAAEGDSFVAMMQFVDWLWYSDGGQEFAKYGVEGVTYTSSGAGRYKVADGISYMGSDPSAPKDLQKDYGFTNGEFAYGGSWALVSSSFSPDEKAFQDAMAGRKLLPVDPAHPLKADEQEQATLWDTPLKDHVTQNTLKFALGKRPMSEWDAYLAELKAKNMQRYIDLHNTAYERFKKEHG